jgi:hypothetical protein
VDEKHHCHESDPAPGKGPACSVCGIMQIYKSVDYIIAAPIRQVIGYFPAKTALFPSIYYKYCHKYHKPTTIDNKNYH